MKQSNHGGSASKSEHDDGSNFSSHVDITKDAIDDKLNLSCANTTVLSYKSSTDTNQDEEDSPCWIGKDPHKNLASSVQPVTSKQPTDDRSNNVAIKTSILTPNSDENVRDRGPKTVIMSDSKKLNPSARLFVPSTAKQSPFVHEKQRGFESGYGVYEIGSTSSSNPGLDLGKKKLNPLAPKFYITDTKTKAYGYEKNEAAASLSPKMDVKELLKTINCLSELVTFAHGSALDVEELDLVNSTVQNLNLYIKNSGQVQAWNQSVARGNSYDLKFPPDKTKLSSRDRDLQLPMAMGVDLYGATQDKVMATNGYLQNQQVEDQNSPHVALFYKSLWLKAEAERCLLVYETSLSNDF